MQVLDCVVTQSIVPVSRRLQDINAVSAVELIKFVSITDNETHPTPFGTGRAPLQKYLYLAQRHTCISRRFTPGKAQSESQFTGVKIDGGTDIGDRQHGMVLFTVDGRGSGRGQCPLLTQAVADLKQFRLASKLDAKMIVSQPCGDAAARRA